LSKAAAETDAVIIGLGAAGAIAAMVLTNAGLEVTGIEAGPFHADTAFMPDELGAAENRNLLGPKFNGERPVWREGPGLPSQAPLAAIGQMMNGVGGSTVHYGGWARRFFPGDFIARTRTIERYGRSAIPTGSTLADWPISYDDLETYYTRVERLLGVAGIAANVRNQPHGNTGNPFEGWRSEPYPLPPLRSFPLGERFERAARDLGWHPYPVPAAILSREYGGRPACTYCGWCSGYGCRIGAKSSTLVTAVPRALATGRLTIQTNTRATQVITKGGRAVGVRYVKPGHGEEEIRARAVILAAYTYENVRLLLLSRTSLFPDGLGNNRGQVGKHFMSRGFLGACGVIAGEQLNRFAGPVGQAMCVDDLNGDHFSHEGMDFIRGGTISVENQLQPLAAANTVPPWVPAWGRPYKEFLVRNWNSVAVLRAQPEPLPWQGNELDLDPSFVEEGPVSLPRVRITYRQRDNDEGLAAFLFERMEECLTRMGAGRTWRLPHDRRRVLSGHDVGGTRMGDDPRSSVVDADGRVHELENLHVLGGSTFPTSSGCNPTLTIQALAWRSCERLAGELGGPGTATNSAESSQAQ